MDFREAHRLTLSLHAVETGVSGPAAERPSSRVG